jgi:hypothetical protein
VKMNRNVMNVKDRTVSGTTAEDPSLARRAGVRMSNGCVVLALFAAGCGPLATSVNTPRTEVVHALDASAVFCALADAVDHQTCRDATTLARLIDVHRRNGWLGDAAVAAFDAAFPDAASKQRDLTSDDATKLRSLK